MIKTKRESLVVSFGNKKLPKTTMIFNLPAVKTCPGKTELCSKSCYALKAERIYPNVPPARKRNLKASLGADFTSKMIGNIQKARHKIDAVRVHESGDFYSQAYLDKWFLIATEFPSLRFYAYTKSFSLDHSRKPSNFRLLASFDHTTTEADKINYSMRKKAFDNTFTIVGKNDKASCIGDCTICSKCWTKKGLNITVNKH